MNKQRIEELLFIDYKPAVFDEKAKKINSGKVCRGNLRLTNGMWRTDKEKEEYIKTSLERELP